MNQNTYWKIKKKSGIFLDLAVPPTPCLENSRLFLKIFFFTPPLDGKTNKNGYGPTDGLNKKNTLYDYMSMLN